MYTLSLFAILQGKVVTY